MAIKLKNSKGESMEFGNLKGGIFFEKLCLSMEQQPTGAKQAKLNKLFGV